MSEEIKVPCGGFSIGTGLSLAGGVLSADSSGSGIMSFETFDEYISYCKTNGAMLAYVTNDSRYTDVNFPALCFEYYTEELEIEGKVTLYYVSAIDTEGFLFGYVTGSGVTYLRTVFNHAYVATHLHGCSVSSLHNRDIKLIFQSGLVQIDFDNISGYYWDSGRVAEGTITLKSYDGKKTAVIIKLTTPDSEGYDYTITIIDNTSTGS